MKHYLLQLIHWVIFGGTICKTLLSDACILNRDNDGGDDDDGDGEDSDDNDDGGHHNDQ